MMKASVVVKIVVNAKDKADAEKKLSIAVGKVLEAQRENNSVISVEEAFKDFGVETAS